MDSDHRGDDVHPVEAAERQNRMNKLMPERPTIEMMEAAHKAMSNSTIRNPSAASWDAMVAYRAMWAVMPAPTEGED
jgi:hypothetical protein